MTTIPHQQALSTEQTILHVIHFVCMTFTVAFLISTLLFLIIGYPLRAHTPHHSEAPAWSPSKPASPTVSQPSFQQAQPAPPKSIVKETDRLPVQHRNATAAQQPRLTFEYQTRYTRRRAQHQQPPVDLGITVSPGSEHWFNTAPRQDDTITFYIYE